MRHSSTARSWRDWSELDAFRARFNGFVPIRDLALAMLFTGAFCAIVAGTVGYGVGLRHSVDMVCNTNHSTQ